MTVQEIKDAVDQGKTVNWKTSAYRVEKWKCGYVIHCLLNGHAIGLTWTDEKTLNGKEEDFHIS